MGEGKDFEEKRTEEYWKTEKSEEGVGIDDRESFSEGMTVQTNT